VGALGAPTRRCAAEVIVVGTRRVSLAERADGDPFTIRGHARKAVAEIIAPFGPAARRKPDAGPSLAIAPG